MSDSFSSLGLSSGLLSTLSALGFDAPTPIQEGAIPAAVAGKDVLGLAQTGTGKTLAFSLPLLDHLMRHPGKPAGRTARALILAPTRELVSQIATAIKPLARGTPTRVSSVVGGAAIVPQIRTLERGTDILVATPGRLLDLVERKAIDLSQTGFLVLDEADRMLDLGFITPLKRIAKLVGQPRQTLLFSATMAKEMEGLAQAFLTDPIQVRVAKSGQAVQKIAQEVHILPQSRKPLALKQCLKDRTDKTAIVFTRTRYGAERVTKSLITGGFEALAIHGDKKQAQRERSLKAFRNGRVPILVATDVAARGLDIPNVGTVYNYDLPEVAETYIHRIGRTGRAGEAGEAIAFCTPNDLDLLNGIERLMKSRLTIASGKDLLKDTHAASPKKPTPKKGKRPSTAKAKPTHKKPSLKKSRRPKSTDAKQPGPRGLKRKSKPA